MHEHPLLAGLDEVRRNWGWFLAMGIALIVLGLVALGATALATFATVVLLGWLLIVSGCVETVAAFWARRWSGFFLHLLSGIINLVIGALIVGHPLAAAAGLTLLLAVLFLTGGLFRIIAVAAVRYPGWGWAVVDGVVSVFLGAMIWAEWPSSALWVIGTFVGIVLIFRGWAWVMFAVAARKLPSASELNEPSSEVRVSAH